MIMLRNVLVMTNSLNLLIKLFPQLSEKGLPIITFSENMTFYQNNE